MKFYHGTSSKFLEAILRDGFLCSYVTGNKTERRGTNLDHVYLTQTYDHAIGYALRACIKFGGGSPIVFTIECEGAAKQSQYQWKIAHVPPSCIVCYKTIDEEATNENMVEYFRLT